MGKPRPDSRSIASSKSPGVHSFACLYSTPLREFHDQTGHTTLFVTHDQEEAFELADRVAILNQGRVEQVGAPRIIQTEPASAFVAAFVEGTAPALKPIRALKIAQNQLSYARAMPFPMG